MISRTQVAIGIRIDDALDQRLCGLPHRRERKCPAGHSAGFAGRGPEREVGHARQLLELNATQRAHAMHYRVKQGAQDARARYFELPPKLRSRNAVAPLQFGLGSEKSRGRPSPAG